eukprot:SAG31_NODE_1316_length_8838_cov_11.005031_8_plen_368_part_00
MKMLAQGKMYNKKMYNSPYKGIVGAYNLFECKESSDLVLEKAGGGELFDIMLDRHEKGQMNEARASQWIRDILEAIAYCHSKGIVHLDLKPENCLLVDTSLDPPQSPWESNLKLADFGLATEIKSGRRLQEPTGTMEYVAPEVIDLMPGTTHSKGYSFTADIWSIGVLTYIILLADLPYKKPHPRPNLKLPSIRRQTGFKNLSPDAQNFMQSIFVDAAERPRAAELLKHSFIERHAPRVWVNLRRFRAKGRAIMLIVRLRLFCKSYSRAQIEAKAAGTPLDDVAKIWELFRGRKCFSASHACVVRAGFETDSEKVMCNGEPWQLQQGDIIDELDTRYYMASENETPRPRLRFLLNAAPSAWMATRSC